MTSHRLHPVTELMTVGEEETDGKRKCSSISGGPVCARCRQSIVDRYFLSALGTSWHVGCLSCQHCQRPLDSQMTCFTRDGKIYCRDDYYRLFAHQLCSRCLGPVSAHELVMFARQHVYHVDCFVCAVCQRRLMTGQHFGMQHGAIYCQAHYELVVCRQSPGNEVTSPSHHPPTVVTPSEYAPNDDYERVLTGVVDVQQVPSAAVCTDLGLSAGGPQSDSLTLALSPPPAYTVLDGHQVAAQQTPPDVLSRRSAPPVQAPFYNGVGASQKGRPRKRCKVALQPDCSPQPASDGDPYNTSGFGDVGFGDIVGCDLDLLRHGGVSAYGRLKDGTGLSGSACGRQKRLRTSFKHHQLRSMKAYFALNHNPDAKDLKELAQKTGLTKRVLQVWFQNARAKYRRNTLKQEQQERNQIHQVAPADSTANSTSSISTASLEKTSGRAAALPDLSPHHHQNGTRSSSGGSRPSQAGMTSSGPQRSYPVSRSPASLSDVSSTQSSSNDMLSAGLVGNNNHATTAGLLLTDIDRGIVTDSMSMFSSANYLIEKIP